MYVFAILAHNKPQNLELLLETLRGECVFLHIDKSVNRRKFCNILNVDRFPNLTVLSEEESIKVSWGGYSVVQAEFQLIQSIISKGKPFDKIVFLSGEDFPIKPILEFKKYLATRENFISLQEIKPDLNRGPAYIENQRIARISYIHNMDLRLFKRYKGRNFLNTKICQAPFKILARLKIRNPIFDPTKKYFVGSQWIAISNELAKLLLMNESILRQEFRFTFAPDELTIQTFYGRNLEKELINSDEFDAVIDASFHLVPPGFTVGGQEWQTSHLQKIIESNKFFVRKPCFDLLLELKKRYYL